MDDGAAVCVAGVVLTQPSRDRTELRRERRRCQILGAALAAFAEKGVHSTRVSEIAARSGVSQGTIYLYFDSKDEMVRAAFVERFEQLLAPIFNILDDASRSSRERLTDVAEASLDVFNDNPELAFLLLQVMSTQSIAEMVAHDFGEYYGRLSAAVAPLFEEIGDPDPEATAVLYLGTLDGLMLQRLLAPGLVDRSKTLRQLATKFNLEVQTWT